jgi:hypothetical protein
MGRCNNITESDKDLRFHLVALRFQDGDYDEGGAYWGYVSGTQVYWAYSGVTDGTEEEQVMFIRAKSREAAKDSVRESFPKAKFYR